MAELEKYGLLSLGSIAVLLALLVFSRRDLDDHAAALAAMPAAAPASGVDGMPPERALAPERAAPMKKSVGNRPARPPRTHEVAAGETLEAIAERYLGAADRWPELAAVNPGLDARKLVVGKKLKLPAGLSTFRTAAPRDVPIPSAPALAPAKSSPPTTAGGRQHRVAEGDRLAAIALRYYGDATRWKAIFKANQARLKTADSLPVGALLTIP